MEALRSLVELEKPGNLTTFLAGFQYTAPALAGDLAAIERVAWEFCEVIRSWRKCFDDDLCRMQLTTGCSTWSPDSVRTFSWTRRGRR